MLDEAEHRLPCLLDRLIDEAPGQESGPAERRTVSLKHYRMAVLRDLRWLLNSPQRLKTDEIWDYPEAASSVVNYGTRDLAGHTSSSIDPYEIESEISRVITQFEPRIIPESLRVRLVQESHGESKLSFEINGQLWALPYAERILFRTEMDLETGMCELSIVS